MWIISSGLGESNSAIFSTVRERKSHPRRQLSVCSRFANHERNTGRTWFTSWRPCWGRELRTCCHSVRLHAQLSQITAIVPLCHSIRQLQLSQYTCRWENWIMSYPGTLGGAVPILTSGNRNTSGWPFYVTSCRGIQEKWRTKSETKLHLCTFRIWCTW